MSLIEEALRRMQEPVDPSAPSKPKPAQQPAAAPAIPTPPSTASFPPTGPSPRTIQHPSTPRPRSTPVWLAVVIAVLMLAAGLIGGGIVWIGRTVGAVRRAANAEGVKTIEATETAVPPTGQQPFALNGVVEGVGEPYAVINGAIVGIGDQVGDATLVEVRNGSATLEHVTGKRTVLRIPR